jgi:hypothetical protein
MGRHREYPDLYIKTYLWWSMSGKPSAASVIRHLDETSEEEISPATVRRWVVRFKELVLELQHLDEPFEWSRTEEYGLPWEAGNVLLGICNVESFLRKSLIGLPPVTVREARWCWRVHLAAPTIADPKDLLAVGRSFAAREFRRDLLAEPLYMADLESWLTYQPWQGFPKDTDRVGEYMRAVNGDLIPGLRPGGSNPQSEYETLSENEFTFAQAVFALGAFWPTLPLPWLLPSQRDWLESQGFTIKEDGIILEADSD